MYQSNSPAGEQFRKILIATAKGSKGARDMSREQAKAALSFLISTEAHPAQIGAFLTAMRFKGARVEEMKGFLDAMEESATLISPKVERLLNCNGPYDGRKKALHLSLAAALLTAAAGVPVVMHSNSGLPPKNGVTTAAVLEAMGIPAYQEPQQVARSIEEKGFGHLHASRYLHGVERLKPIRQTLFYRSFLHACEVMLNPAGAGYSIIGAAHKSFLQRFATAAAERGQQRVMAVQGLDGCDELPMQPVAVADYHQGELSEYTLDPADYGMTCQEHQPCADPQTTAALIVSMFQGKASDALDPVLYNSGVRLYLCGKVEGISDGIELARETLFSGRAAETMRKLQGC
ncbi:MAG: anthranilate phosphoribosyltransferase [Chromatiales bacterium]|nr:anthranilate phosphoribosyltransferase [Chromatiales bacterium]